MSKLVVNVHIKSMHTQQYYLFSYVNLGRKTLVYPIIKQHHDEWKFNIMYPRSSGILFERNNKYK